MVHLRRVIQKKTRCHDVRQPTICFFSICYSAADLRIVVAIRTALSQLNVSAESKSTVPHPPKAPSAIDGDRVEALATPKLHRDIAEL
jgi:hypothetical protein